MSITSIKLCVCFYSLFSIVTFPNSACDTSSGDTGTCLSSSECQGRGGFISGRETHLFWFSKILFLGTCANGFGSCCLQYLNTCGGTVNQNCTYIQ